MKTIEQLREEWYQENLKSIRQDVARAKAKGRRALIVPMSWSMPREAVNRYISDLTDEEEYEIEDYTLGIKIVFRRKNVSKRSN